MKKIFYLLICLIIFAGCDNVVLRKDKSERVTFNKEIPQGEYTLYMYELKYPEKQEEKIIFLSKFENFLKNRVEGLTEDVTFILPKNMYDDVNAVLNNEGIGIERAFFKSASYIDENDKKIIDRETKFVRTPKDAGEVQKYLNKQYYYILSLFGKQKEYKENFLYSEYDKRVLTAEYLNERKELKNILSEKKKNFVVAVERLEEVENYKNDLVYLKNSSQQFDDSLINGSRENIPPVLILNSGKYTGYTVNKNSVVLFAGSGKERLNYFRRYDFTTIIKKIDSFNYSNFVIDKKQAEISVLLNRKKYVPKRPLSA